MSPYSSLPLIALVVVTFDQETTTEWLMASTLSVFISWALDPLKLAAVTWFVTHGLVHLGCKKRKKVHLKMAAKAVAFGEALRPEFKEYSQRVVDNAAALADTLISRGFDIVAGGTDTHLMLVDLRSKGLTGVKAEDAMENARMTCNKNGVPFDPEKPTVTSGIRLGSPAGTTRGFGVAEFKQIGNLIADVLDGLAANPDDNSAAEKAAGEAVGKLCSDFPIYGNL